MNLETFRKKAYREYQAVSNDDIDRIIARVCQLPRLELFLNDRREVSETEKTTLNSFLKRRADNVPLQYIFGEAPFREFNLTVGEGVLIPRPETEMLVDLALEHLPENAMVCDVGTGTGAIALAIASARKDTSVFALELSDKAIKYAHENIKKYQLENISLIKSDLLSAVKEKKFDLISANLPYVADDFYMKLDCEVRNFEPKDALLSDNHGMAHIERLAKSAKDFLLPNGRIIFEFSPEQEQGIICIMSKNGYHDIEIIKDLNQHARFAIGKV